MRIFKYLRFLLAAFAFHLVLSFLLTTPTKSASDLMWEGYYEQEDLDTLFVGSSLCKVSFNPLIFDECLGTNSYNMGTPSQAMSQTLRSVEIALKEHDIQTIIFGMSYSSFKHEPVGEAELTFEKARVTQRGGIQSIFDTINYLYSEDVRTEEKSINFLFPWLYNRSEISLEMIKQNVSMKLQGKSGSSDDPLLDNAPFYKGYQNATTAVVNYDNRWVENSYWHYDAEFDEDMIAELEELMQLCQEKGVELIIINTPRPSFDTTVCYEYFEDNEREFTELCEKYNVDYYDFNLAKQEAFQSQPDYYSDHEHLNEAGATAFANSLCELLIRRENGEDVEKDFMTFDEFLEIYSFWFGEWKAIVEK